MRILLNILFLFSAVTIYGQQYKGFPTKEEEKLIRQHFYNPPKGYGNVPFYWWTGDSLKKERLLYELDILSEAAIDGFSVSYMHTNPHLDTLYNGNGYGGYGRPDPGKPEVFSEEWWNIWNWFSAECDKRGIGVGLDDYVVGWKGNGYYVDDALKEIDASNYQGRLNLFKIDVGPYGKVDTVVPYNVIEAISYPDTFNLTDEIKDNRLTWQSDSKNSQIIYVIYTTPSSELHPQYGTKLREKYFETFDNKLDADGRKGMNYFFQDELVYELTITSWCAEMRDEFLKRKGYDVMPYLPALFDSIGTITPKIRLDYSEVVIQLAEERYFKPIFDWHNDRGLIYGLDNEGRGLQPTRYMDYFRAESWYTAPGNDAPARGSSFVNTKVSSSVAHLYGRPRTWLEAFHSIGWSANGYTLTSQLDHHLIAGGNLLCLHGLYYSTHGGWWEWAPPCFFFRMPYWPHMKQWIKYGERMCYLLSQGRHVCDVVILYPTETLQAYPETKIERLWEMSKALSNSGIDYDYADYQSIRHADVCDGSIRMADESYKVIVLPALKAIHDSSVKKLLEFHRNGGIIVALDTIPTASSLSGENDSYLAEAMREIFASNSGFIVKDINQVPDVISNAIQVDFKTSSGEGLVLHRQIADNDLYMVLNIHDGDSVFFRKKGKLEIWNAQNGEIKDAPVLSTDKFGTWVRFEGDSAISKLYVFSPGEPVFTQRNKVSLTVDTIAVEGNWAVTPIPTMDNRWGDFRLPASDDTIGVEAREFMSIFADKKGILRPDTNIYGYAPYMTTICLDTSINLDRYVHAYHDTDKWNPYSFSWQYGVKDSPGSQGYHGLKGRVDNRFIILGEGAHQLFATYVYAPKSGEYRIVQEGVKPDYLLIDGIECAIADIELTKGWHKVLIVYASTKKKDYVLAYSAPNTLDNRDRSAIVFYPSDELLPLDRDPYDNIIGMKWYGSNHLTYYPYKETRGKWIYKFKTAPGTKQLTFDTSRKIKNVTVDGRKMKIKGNIVDIANPNKGVSDVVLEVCADIGLNGSDLFLSPVKMKCEGGEIPLGDWSQQGALKYFSGGMRYEKTVALMDDEKLANKVELNLGMVDATCEISVNGEKLPDVFLAPPYKADITKYVKSGDNKIEVIVYSSLSNHYQTIPSAYRGAPCAGLLGPVFIELYR